VQSEFPVPEHAVAVLDAAERVKRLMRLGLSAPVRRGVSSRHEEIPGYSRLNREFGKPECSFGSETGGAIGG
jgi:hypothetical protein